jgi:hypothetical protein
MRFLQTFVRAGLVVLAGTTATTSFADNGSASVDSVAPKPMVVLSNGQNYTGVDVNFLVSIKLRLKFDTGSVGGVKSWRVHPTASTGYGVSMPVGGLEAYSEHKTYGQGNRPKKIDRTETILIPVNLFQGLAIQMCEFQATKLRQQGKSDAEIFGQDRMVSFNVWGNASVDSTGAGSGNQEWQAIAAKSWPVKCAKFKGSKIPKGPGGIGATAKVESAVTKLKEINTQDGTCQIRVTTAIRTDIAGATIGFRYVHSDGKKSEKFSVNTAANKIAVVTHTWDIPNGPGPETGWIKIEGTKPSFISIPATYTMKCRSKGAPGGVKLGN